MEKTIKEGKCPYWNNYKHRCDFKSNNSGCKWKQKASICPYYQERHNNNKKVAPNPLKTPKNTTRGQT